MVHYEIVEELASGASGIVYKAINTLTKQPVAIKRLKKRFTVSQSMQLGELVALQEASHPNVVKLLEVLRSNKGSLMLIFEYMESSLLDFLHHNKGNLSETRARNMMYQILRGLSYLHVVVKPENILFSPGDICKIADLGEAQRMNTRVYYSEYMMTRWYRAPEVLLRLRYDAAIDVWSAGCIFAELLNGQPLFPARNEREQMQLIVSALKAPDERWPEGIKALSERFPHAITWYKRSAASLAERFLHVSFEALQLLSDMLEVAPAYRVTATKALGMPFFTLPLGN